MALGATMILPLFLPVDEHITCPLGFCWTIINKEKFRNVFGKSSRLLSLPSYEQHVFVSPIHVSTDGSDTLSFETFLHFNFSCFSCFVLFLIQVPVTKCFQIKLHFMDLADVTCKDVFTLPLFKVRFICKLIFSMLYFCKWC